MFAVASVAFLAFSGSIRAATWYVDDVATSGDGSSTAPFNRVQAATNAANPGDVVIIRAGTYRETVTPARSGTVGAPIVYRGEKGAVISGADRITGWTQHSGSIYKASMPWTMGPVEQPVQNMVIVNDQLMNEARWPNMAVGADPVADAKWAVLESGDWTKEFADTTMEFTVRDDQLPMAASQLIGARIHVLGGWAWVSESGPLFESVNATTFKVKLRSIWYAIYGPKQGNRYYLFGSLKLLDSEGEWFRDASTDTLYLYQPGGGDPSSSVVEAQRRQWAFDLSGRSSITLENIAIRAASIKMDNSSSGNVLNGLDIKYIGQIEPSEKVDVWDAGVEAGVQIAGSGNTLKNCTVAYSGGNGLWVKGSNQVVTNNVIHTVNMCGGDRGAIDINGSNHEISYNTLHNSPRGLVKAYGTGTRLIHNELYNGMKWTDDGGSVYAYQNDGNGYEIAYNVIDDVHSGTGWQAQGIYLDNYTRNYQVHHNIVYDVDVPMWINARYLSAGEQGAVSSVQTNQVVNNTFVSSGDRAIQIGNDGNTTDMSASKVYNNICISNGGGSVVYGNTMDFKTNLVINNNNGSGGGFVSLANHDFRLTSASPAVDYGTVLSPYTDGFSGSKPDAGAIELNTPMFKFGAQPFDPPAGAIHGVAHSVPRGIDPMAKVNVETYNLSGRLVSSKESPFARAFLRCGKPGRSAGRSAGIGIERIKTAQGAVTRKAVVAR